jgi:hypothetical protein
MEQREWLERRQHGNRPMGRKVRPVTDVASTVLRERRNGGMPVGYSGMNSLKEGAK